ncbi:hypothetical protein J2Y55_004604 [Bosea sp. BE125]|uniref:hypothetical protein n=1 Tax=Bosea sp. BE125 TaxID=2817909 RepID=UPI002856DF94|nr:hypothetical protein [Bosea sp. BE125]MDR6873577.1 hypothetical protein [Bosea sp. BE125]
MLGESDEIGNPLNSDELGEKGESTFKTICADARLICNSATRDRAGWDFLVEFPLGREQPVTLDKRENPISCLFQQKTMWDHNDRIKFRLSSLERLAKDSRPSFVYVLKVSKESLQPTSAYLIHMHGDVLAKILKKLRLEEAADRLAVNHAEIYLSASEAGIVLTPDGAALKTAIQAAIGSNMAAYEAAKRNELRSLGYEPFAREMKVTFTVKDKDALTNILLGQTKAAVDDMRTFETRFGIKLETGDLTGVHAIRFQPFPFDSCEVVVRRDKFSEPATFKGHIYMPPKVQGADFAARIVTDMFEVNFRGTQFSLNTTEVTLDLPVLTPSVWRKYFLLADALSAGAAVMEIRPGNRAVRSMKHVMNGKVEIDRQELEIGLETSPRLTTLIGRVGASEEPSLSRAQLVLQEEYIASAHAIVSGKSVTPLCFSVAEDAAHQLGQEMRGLHVNYVSFEKDFLVWAADVVFERSAESPNKFTAKELTFREIAIIKPETYAKYLDELRDEAKAEIVMSRELDNEATN